MNPMSLSICKPGYEAWWKALTRRGDPLLRPYLTADAFIAGYEYAKTQVFEDLAEELQSRARNTSELK